jgi:importin subunit beta-1
MTALPLLITMMKDPSVHVKDTTAWTLGRISEIIYMDMLPPDQLRALIEAVGAGLLDQPRVASNCAWVYIFIIFFHSISDLNLVL